MNEVHITPSRISEAISRSIAQEVKRQETKKRINARRITESIMEIIKNGRQNLTESKNGEKTVNLTATQLRNLVNETVLREWMEKNMGDETLETFDYSQIPDDLENEAEELLRNLWEEGNGYQTVECHVDYTLDDGVVEVSCNVVGYVSKHYDAGDYYTAPYTEYRTRCVEITDIDVNIYDDKTNECWSQEKVNEKIKDLDFSDLDKMVDREF